MLKQNSMEVSLYIYTSASCRAVVDGKGCAFKEEDILYLKFQKKGCCFEWFKFKLYFFSISLQHYTPHNTAGLITTTWHHAELQNSLPFFSHSLFHTNTNTTCNTVLIPVLL